jgi:hypothetical protein
VAQPYEPTSSRDQRVAAVARALDHHTFHGRIRSWEGDGTHWLLQLAGGRISRIDKIREIELFCDALDSAAAAAEQAEPEDLRQPGGAG